MPVILYTRILFFVWALCRLQSQSALGDNNNHNNDDDSRNQFEHKILLSLRGPVLLEAMWNDDIRFTEDEWLNLIESKAQASTLIDRMMRCWAQIPELLRQGRLGLQQQRQEILPGLIQQVRQIYEMFLFIASAYKHNYSDFKANPVLHTPSGLSVERMAHVYHRICSLSLGLGLVSSSIAQGLHMGLDATGALDLQAEALLLCEQILLLAEEGLIYRPIGSGHMIICLPAAWSATLDSSVRARLLHMYSFYASDLPGDKSLDAMEKSSLESNSQRLRVQTVVSQKDHSDGGGV